ncbi:MAG: DUF433 domain-containing protein [Sulfuricellaceae bacterium]|nr:DUF433 domain-containing protein [Sulfuricellaceae bacterium]
MNKRKKMRIVTNPAILAGKPIVAGTRISVELILDRLAFGWRMEELIEAYPHIAPEDVLAALAFAADVLRRKPFVTVAEIEVSIAKEERNLDLCS